MIAVNWLFCFQSIRDLNSISCADFKLTQFFLWAVVTFMRWQSPWTWWADMHWVYSSLNCSRAKAIRTVAIVLLTIDLTIYFKTFNDTTLSSVLPVICISLNDWFVTFAKLCQSKHLAWIYIFILVMYQRNQLWKSYFQYENMISGGYTGWYCWMTCFHDTLDCIHIQIC